MKKLLAGLTLAALPLLATDSRDGRTDSLERSFVAGGRIRLELSAGDYTIIGSPDDKIHVEWTVREPRQLKQVSVTAKVNGSEADVETDGPSNHFRVRIRVPARSDLRVRLSAGDLKVEGIEGNKDIEAHAGDLSIDVGRVSDLKRVEASVWAGDINASALKVSKGGLFRSLSWSGGGRYQIEAHLKAGDLRLYSKAGS